MIKLTAMVLGSLLTIQGFSQAKKVTAHKVKDTNDSFTASKSTIVANNIVYPFSNNGMSGAIADPASVPISYQNPNNSLSYGEGLIWATGNSPDEYRVGGSNYISSLQPGKILTSGNESNNYTAVADDPSLAKYRIYKIKKGWESLPSGAERDQYEKDYNEWPVADGAPVNDDGTPKYLGDETAFYIANDMNVSGANQLYKSLPIGLELRSTIWAINDSVLGNTIFRKVELTNRSGKNMDYFRIGLWTDPDVLNAANDRVGFDRVHAKMFTFTDPKLSESEMLQQNLTTQFVLAYEMLTWNTGSSQTVWTNGGTADDNPDPVFGTDAGRVSMAAYSLGGLKNNGQPFVDPITHTVQTEAFGGDPLSNKGFTDINYFTSGNDRRAMMNFYPDKFDNGSTLSFTYVIKAYEGKTVADALYKMRTEPRNHVYFYKTGEYSNHAFAEFNPSNKTIHVRIQDEKATSIKALLKRRESSETFWRRLEVAPGTVQLYDDGTHGDLNANDKIWALTFPITNDLKNIEIDLEVTYPNKTVVVDNWVSDMAIYPEIQSDLTVTSDNINQNGIIENGENIQFKIAVQSSEDLTVNKMKLYFGTYSESLTGLVSNEVENQTMLGGVVICPSAGTFGFAAKVNQNFNYLDVVNGQIDGYFNLADNVVIRNQVPVTIQKIGLSMNMILTKKIKGNPNSGLLGARTYGSLYLNSDYNISVQADPLYDNYGDSIIIGYQNYKTTIKREYPNGNLELLAQGEGFPDQYGFNQPIFHNIILTKGTANEKSTIMVNKTPGVNLTSMYLSDSNDPELRGYYFGYNFLGTSIKNFITDIPAKIEIRFDSSTPQNGYFYNRVGVGNYSYSGYFSQPFQVWDVSDPNNERQLNFMVVENSYGTTGSTVDHVWNPTIEANDREYLMILNSTYDGTEPDLSGTNHLDYTQNKPSRKKGSEIDNSISLWLVKKNHDTPAYNDGDKMSIAISPAVADGDEFTFNSVYLQKVTGVEEGENVSKSFGLDQNYPNPFNPNTVISYNLATSGDVRLVVYDLLGREVATLVNEKLSAGTHKANFDGHNLTSGVYFYKLTAGNFTQTKKMILAK